MERAHGSKDVAHLLHGLGKSSDGGQYRRALQVPQELVAVSDTIEVVERRVVDRQQVEFLASGVDGAENLVEIEVYREAPALKRDGRPTDAIGVKERRCHWFPPA